MSLVYLGCLSIIAVIILLMMLFRTIWTSDGIDLSRIAPNWGNRSTDTESRTHLDIKDDSGELFRIAIISDSENDWDYVKRALDEVKSEGITTVIHTGDVTKLGVPENLNTARDILRDSGLTAYVIPGDRDLWKSGGEATAFQNAFGSSYQLVEKNGVNLLLIDNSNEYEGIDSTEWAFINKNLPLADFVFLHNPIYFSDSSLLGDKGMGEYSAEVDAQRKELLELIRKSPAKAVFAGDQHFFSENPDSEDNDLMHYVMGALNSTRNLQRPNFVILTVFEDGNYSVKQVRL